jgi:hypothetical protein
MKGEAWRPDLLLDWVAKLPNSPDDGGLGTDETDVVVGLYAQWSISSWRAGVGGGLAIFGDPLQFANQDDAGFWALQVSRENARSKLSATLDWRVASARNPSRAQVLAGGQLRGLPGGLWMGVEGALGLNPAAPDWQAGLLFGVEAPCRVERGD